MVSKPCLEPRCPNDAHRGPRCPEHTKQHQAYRDRWRGNACERGYGYRWQQMRKRVLARDGSICSDCGRTPPDVRLTIDYVIPLAHGGSNALDNLRVLCLACNGSRGGKTRRVWLDGDVS